MYTVDYKKHNRKKEELREETEKGKVEDFMMTQRKG